MTTAYTPVLKLALPVTGELGGTWGTVVNDNITSMVEQAIAGLSTISSWTANSHTLTTADGTTSESRCAMLVLVSDGSGNPSAAATVICPNATKLYVVKNTSGQTATIKTAAGTGVAVSNGDTTFVFCDGTNVNSVVTSIVNGHVTGNLTVDGTTSLQGTTATQVDITAQGDLRLQDSAGGQYVAIQAPTTVTASYTLTLPIDDGTSGQALITDGSGNLSWSSAASGDVYGPASATDNAIARYDGTTGKLIQNSAVTIADDGATVIDANSTTDALRITQTGIGNALLVEDSANPDATPFVIDASGNVVIGATSQDSLLVPTGPLQIVGDNIPANIALARYQTGSGQSTSLNSYKANGTKATPTISLNGDRLGSLNFYGYDGTAFIQAVSIRAEVDGTPGTNDMPGRLVFSTTADGANSSTERMRISSAGNVGIGGTPGADSFGVYKNLTGGINGFQVSGNYTIQSDVTASANTFTSYPTTVASAFTLVTLRHFYAWGRAFGAGSTVTNQYGYFAESSLTGATNNYGFFSNIASGTGRYNFYANGTAQNYMAGGLAIGTSVFNTGYGSVASANFANGASVTFNGTGGSWNQTTTGGAITYFTDNSLYIDAKDSNSQIIFRVNGATTRAQIGSSGIVSLGAGQGAESLRVTPVASAVNCWQFYGGAAATGISMYATGTDTNISINYVSKGNGAHYFNSNAPSTAAQFAILNTASAVNYLQVYGSATGNAVTFESAGSDADIWINNKAKGAGNHQFYTNNNLQFRIAHTASAVNYLQVSGSSSTFPVLSAQGSSANVDMLITAKGTGAINLQTNYTTQFRIGHTASAVNYLNVTGGATGTATSFYAQGSDANVGINYISKGNLGHFFYTGTYGSGVPQFAVAHTASAVNYLKVTGAATGGYPILGVEGSDTNVGFFFATKGSGSFLFNTATGGARQVSISAITSAVNSIDLAGSATGSAVNLSAQGSDTNIDIKLTPKGTGVVQYGTYTAGVVAQAGYIQIKDAAGNVRRLLVG